jgi:hypothetical protein
MNTRLWALTRKGNDPLKLLRRVEIKDDVFLVRADGQIGHSLLGVTNWSESGIAECTREVNSLEVTLPRIRISGFEKDIVDMVNSLAMNLVSYSKSFMGPSYEGTLDLIDLWCRKGARTTVDIAMAYSKEALGFLNAEQVPDFFGWTGLPGPTTCSTCQRWHSKDPAPFYSPALRKFTALVAGKPCWVLFDAKGCSGLVPLGTILRPSRYRRPWVI